MTLPAGVHLGVSPLSWINEVIPEFGADTTAETCLRDAAAAGYAGVETSRKFPADAGTLRYLLGGFGLLLASGWYSGELADRDVDAELRAVAPHARLLAAMGCGVMVYGEVGMMASGAPLDAPMSARRRMPPDAVAVYADRLTAFARRLKAEHGLRLAYHHHLIMVAETFDEIAAILDRAGPEVGLLVDTGHAVAGGFDYARLIDRFGDRIAHIHLKDVRTDVLAHVRAGDLSFNAAVRAGLFTIPGDGGVDFAPLARFVRHGGFRGWLVVEAEQDPAKAPPASTVARAFAHVTRLFEDAS